MVGRATFLPRVFIPFFFLGFVLVLALSGCASRPKPPPIRYVTVSCLTQAQLEQLKQAEPEKIGHVLTGQAQEDVKLVAESAVRLRSWGEGLFGVLEGCAEK